MQDAEGPADRAVLTKALGLLADRLDRTDAGRAWRQLLDRKSEAVQEPSTFDLMRRGLLDRLGTSAPVALAYEQVMAAAHALDAVLRSSRGPDLERPRGRPQAPPPLPKAAVLPAKEREPPRPPPRLMDALARARETADVASGRFDEVAVPAAGAGKDPLPETPPLPATDPARLGQLEEEINRLFHEPSARRSAARNLPAIASDQPEVEVEEAEVDIVVQGDSGRQGAPAATPRAHAPPLLSRARRTGPGDPRSNKKPEGSSPNEATVEIVRPDEPRSVQDRPADSPSAPTPAKPLPPPRKP
jgi:hypothetical protein